MRRPFVPFVALVLIASACAPAAESPHAARPTRPLVVLHDAGEHAEPEPEVRSDGHLPATAVPERYAIDLDVDPRNASYTGRVRIRVSVPRATSFVVLSARELHVTRVVADTTSGKIVGHTRGRKSHGSSEEDELVLRFDRPLPVGEATLALDFDATYGESLAGLYRVNEGGAWYAFTQLEATDARRAFPCFDEPAFKVPFDVTVKVPSSMIAVSNTPETWRMEKDGKTTFAFKTTPPLPTYLVALAVGDLDVREGRKSPFPVRLVTVKGKAALGAQALDATEKLVDVLGTYFGIRYPYEKLDVVAVPDFAAGAMENAGLVTFREELLLQDPKHPSTRTQRNQALVIAHELAHQWFGDLVTMRWWDDTWLNEGFATWMEAKAVDLYHPSYQATLEQVGDAQEVMDTDALRSARRVRQPVTSVGEVDEAFDGITYDKGAAVLRMLEGYAGEDAFRRGVTSYLRAHAWGNATAHDLFVELDRASGKRLTPIAEDFLDQTGVPTVSVTRECSASGSHVTVLQFPWQPTGSPPPRHPLPTWDIPVCLGLGPGEPRCFSLDTPRTTFDVPGKCSAWIHPNLGEHGYYRFDLGKTDAEDLAKALPKLDVGSRIGGVANLFSMVRAGSLDADVLLRVLPLFDHEENPYVVEQITGVLDRLDKSAVSDAARPAFRAYVKARLAHEKSALGFAPRAGEEENVALARRAVLLTLAEDAEDEATLKEAETIAARWLVDPTSVDADTGPLALEIASRRAGEPRFRALLDAARHAKAPEHRVAALRALGGFSDPALVARALDTLLDDDTKQQDARYVLRSVMSHRASRPVALAWVRTHWDAALAHFTSHLAHPLLDPVGGICSREVAKDADEFFTPRIASIDGAARPLGEALERALTCAELKDDALPAVDTFFHVPGHEKGRDTRPAAGSPR